MHTFGCFFKINIWINPSSISIFENAETYASKAGADPVKRLRILLRRYCPFSVLGAATRAAIFFASDQARRHGFLSGGREGVKKYLPVNK